MPAIRSGNSSKNGSPPPPPPPPHASAQQGSDCSHRYYCNQSTTAIAVYQQPLGQYGVKRIGSRGMCTNWICGPDGQGQQNQRGSQSESDQSHSHDFQPAPVFPDGDEMIERDRSIQNESENMRADQRGASNRQRQVQTQGWRIAATDDAQVEPENDRGQQDNQRVIADMGEVKSVHGVAQQDENGKRAANGRNKVARQSVDHRQGHQTGKDEGQPRHSQRMPGNTAPEMQKQMSKWNLGGRLVSHCSQHIARGVNFLHNSKRLDVLPSLVKCHRQAIDLRDRQRRRDQDHRRGQQPVTQQAVDAITVVYCVRRHQTIPNPTRHRLRRKPRPRAGSA